MPPSNTLSFAQLQKLTPLIAASADNNAWPIVSIITPLLLIILVGIALVADQRTVYISAYSPWLPFWLRRVQFSFRTELLATACTRMGVLRIWFCYPGHTIFSYAQLAMVLVNGLASNAVMCASSHHPSRLT